MAAPSSVLSLDFIPIVLFFKESFNGVIDSMSDLWLAKYNGLSVLFMGVFFIIHFVSDALFNLIPKVHNFFIADPKKTYKRRMYWNANVNSMVHAIVASAGSMYIQYLVKYFPQSSAVGTILSDPIHGHSTLVDHLIRFSVGYFLYDLFLCIFSYKIFGPTFLLHAIFCVFAFYIALKPLYMGSLHRFLIFEVSTIFLDMFKFLQCLNFKGSLMESLFYYSFLILYIFIRLYLGIYYWAFEIQRYINNTMDIPGWGKVVATYTNIFLHLLNIVWFIALFDKLVERLSPFYYKKFWSIFGNTKSVKKDSKKKE